MKIAAQFKLSQLTFADGKTVTHGEVLVEGFPRLSREAANALLNAHKSFGFRLVKMAPRKLTVKSEEAAARYGRKVGDPFTATDYLSRDLEFDAVVGRSGIASVTDVRPITFDLGSDLDLGEVVEAKTQKPAAQKPAAQAAGAEADELG